MAGVSTEKGLLNFLDERSFRQLALYALCLTLIPATGYWSLGQWQNGIHGHIGSSGPNGWDVSTDFWEALYFSVITETTLGYGDLAPRGWCRLIAAMQVMLGVILGGLAVAKLTSAPGAELRRLKRLASGYWIEVCRVKGKEMVSLSYIGGGRSNTLRYRGYNYDFEGRAIGFFQGELQEASDDELTFTYSNKKSVTEYFEEGMCTHYFRKGNGGRWNYYQATAMDHVKKEKTPYEGSRAQPDEIKIIEGDDPDARDMLIAKYSKRSSH